LREVGEWRSNLCRQGAGYLAATARENVHGHGVKIGQEQMKRRAQLPPCYLCLP